MKAATTPSLLRASEWLVITKRFLRMNTHCLCIPVGHSNYVTLADNGRLAYSHPAAPTPRAGDVNLVNVHYRTLCFFFFDKDNVEKCVQRGCNQNKYSRWRSTNDWLTRSRTHYSHSGRAGKKCQRDISTVGYLKVVQAIEKISEVKF